MSAGFFLLEFDFYTDFISWLVELSPSFSRLLHPFQGHVEHAGASPSCTWAEAGAPHLNNHLKQ